MGKEEVAVILRRRTNGVIFVNYAIYHYFL